MPAAPRDAMLVTCALAALLSLPLEARSDEHCTREDAQAAGPGPSAADGGARVAPAPQADAITAEAVHELPTVTVESPSFNPPPRRGFWPTLFVDHLDLGTRLRALKRLRVVPVFDNARITIFLGVDRRGVAGLHIQQQDPNDLPPLLGHGTPLNDAPPLRAVPLRSP